MGKSVSRLGAARRRRGVNQVDLAERLGMHQASVSDIETRSDDPSSDVGVRTLARYLMALGADRVEVVARFGDGSAESLEVSESS